MENPKIRVERLVKIFGDRPRTGLERFRAGESRKSILEKTGNVLAVAGASFSINEGELFAIMGLSGSGKSTLLRCLNRLIEPTSGQIFVDDEDIAHISEERLREIRRTKMAMVFQEFALFPHRTVAENVEYGLKVTGIEAKQRRKKAIETLEIVGLKPWADRYPDQLSGGMQQRVGLARALATDPDILLMDEAFGALDPLSRRDMQAELIRLQAELKKTIVFISHDIHEALKIGDRVAIMKDGSFAQVGTPEELITQPANDYIRDFMLDINRARVLKAASIAQPMTPIVLGRDSLQKAREQMQRQDRRQIYAVDGDNRPLGIITIQNLENALQAGREEISEAMDENFPQARAGTTIEDIVHLCNYGVAIATVDEQGKFQGAIEPADIIASISGRARSTPEDANPDPALQEVRV